MRDKNYNLFIISNEDADPIYGSNRITTLTIVHPKPKRPSPRNIAYQI